MMRDAGLFRVLATLVLPAALGPRLLALCRNITGRQHAEEQLRKAVDDLAEAQDIARIGIWRFDLATKAMTWSKEVFRILDVDETASGASYDAFLARVHPEDRPRVLETNRVAMETGSPFEVEYRIRTRDGRLQWIREVGRASRARGGRVAGLLGTVQDVTVLKETEAQSARLQLLKTVADNLPNTYLSVIEKGLIVGLTVGGEFKKRNLDPEQFVGATLEQVFGDQAPVVREHYLRTFAGEERSFELFVANQHQLYRTVPLRAADGSIPRILAVVENITARKQAEEALRESEHRLRLANKATNDVIWDWDVANDAQQWNPAGATVFGWTEIVERPVPVRWWLERVHPEDVRRVEAQFVSVMNDPRVDHWSDEYRFLKADGSWAHVLDRGYVLRDAGGKAVRLIGSMLDLTERRRAAETMQAKLQLEDADRRKNEFLALLSHELRNPLAPIRNSLYILDHAVPGGEQARRAQAVISRQVGHMARLIEDLLDVTRISRGKMQLQCGLLELNELVEKTVDDHRGAFDDGGIDVAVRGMPGPVWVSGDRTRLAQVVGNLLQNAAKFTPPGGSVVVSVQQDAACGTAMVRVEDTGRGIVPEMLPRLFKPFTQADTTLDRSKGGLGLGLALVKGLVEMHGGTVEAASGGAGKGAAFTISLPLHLPPAAEAERRAPEGGVPARRVLVIEDNVDAAESLREALGLDGHVVEVAYSGPEGIKKARAFRPDVILCDIGLPEMDGYGVARTLRADPTLDRATLVALTGYVAPADVAKAKEAGFNAHLAKPLDLEVLDKILAGGVTEQVKQEAATR